MSDLAADYERRYPGTEVAPERASAREEKEQFKDGVRSGNRKRMFLMPAMPWHERERDA